MKTIQLTLYKAVLFMVLVICVPAFITGWLVAVNFSGVFETGYKVAFFDIKAAVKESVKDGQQYFYMNGIRFCPVNYTENADYSIIKVSGENENLGKGKHEGGISNQMQQRKMLIARIPQ